MGHELPAYRLPASSTWVPLAWAALSQGWALPLSFITLGNLGTSHQGAKWGWRWQRKVPSQDPLLQFGSHTPGSPAAFSDLIFAPSDDEVQLDQGPCHQLGLFITQHRSLCTRFGACLLPRSHGSSCGILDVGLFRKNWSYPPSPGYYTKL